MCSLGKSRWCTCSSGSRGLGEQRFALVSPPDISGQGCVCAGHQLNIVSEEMKVGSEQAVAEAGMEVVVLNMVGTLEGRRCEGEMGWNQAAMYVRTYWR